MDYNVYLEVEENKVNESKKTLLNKICEEIITPKAMLIQYLGLEQIKSKYFDWSNFSNWNNWPHSR